MKAAEAAATATATVYVLAYEYYVCRYWISGLSWPVRIEKVLKILQVFVSCARRRNNMQIAIWRQTNKRLAECWLVQSEKKCTYIRASEWVINFFWAAPYWLGRGSCQWLCWKESAKHVQGKRNLEKEKVTRKEIRHKTRKEESRDPRWWAERPRKHSKL